MKIIVARIRVFGFWKTGPYLVCFPSNFFTTVLFQFSSRFVTSEPQYSVENMDYEGKTVKVFFNFHKRNPFASIFYSVKKTLTV